MEFKLHACSITKKIWFLSVNGTISKAHDHRGWPYIMMYAKTVNCRFVQS